MAKANNRKHATHKKARAHHAAKTHAHRSNAFRPSVPGVTSPTEAKPESEIVGDESALQSESRVVDDDVDNEAGIYGANRGETAGSQGSSGETGAYAV